MSSPPPFDPYEVLGVSKDAEVDVIKKAHRKLVIKCHPDKVQDESLRARAADEFHKVQRSYEILVDPQERKRYDNQMRLAELKAEQFTRAGGYSATSARPAPSSGAYEYRNGRMYEERAPENAARFFDDEARYFDEPRASARKYDGYERRPSDPRSAEKKKPKTVEVKVGGLFSSGKERVHVRDRDSHSDRKKTRDQERRRDAYDKHSRAAYVEDDSDSDDVSYFARREPERRRYEPGPPRKGKVETRRKETRRSRDDDVSDEWDYGVRVAKEYIQRSKGSAPVEVDRRHSPSRTTPTRVVEAEPDTARRSSGKRSGVVRETMRPVRERGPSIEVVEASPRLERKMPSMPTHNSSPANLKIPINSRGTPPTQRSNTTYGSDGRRESPRLQRTETTPLTTTRHNEKVPSKSSKLRHAETHDSGYSSPGTPEMYHSSSPPKSSTKYMIVEPDDEDTYVGRGHRAVLVEDIAPSRRGTRSPSPHGRRSERPSATTRGSARTTPSRSTTQYETVGPRPSRHEPSRTTRSPPLSRHGSGRGDKLYGEMDDMYKTKYAEDQIRYAKNYGPDDVSYGRYERRGSNSGIHRDAYSHRYDRPAPVERSSTFAY